ncbi:hypothetical protein Q5Y75_05505 [Ruegeria sp. 2205SS24-7]|uniref:hypothetical protein n=1 Tax=Ruegeria discodermiae TaxID=3064389 RepID=UPI0027428B10|nr:hypothetical protein [Ruegeria sp. 2205SS24-7]MDP5216666.1 hypothetical protein [Ruegeria sp. 2205SS24-7]
MRWLVISALSVLAVTGAAAETIYDCEMKNNQRVYGWIPERLVIIVDEQDSTAMAIDDYINHYYDKPIPVTYKDLRNGKFRVTWKHEDMKVRGSGAISATYSALVSKKTGRAQMRVRLGGAADNRPSGQGPCKISKR